MQSYGDQLTTRLRREAAKSRDGLINIQKLYGYVTFDTLTDLSFGEAMLNALEGDAEMSKIGELGQKGSITKQEPIANRLAFVLQTVNSRQWPPPRASISFSAIR